MRQIFLAILIGIFSNAYAFTLSSPSFTPGDKLKPEYTCDGLGIFPGLTWANVPANAQSLVLIVSDPDAPTGTFYHWVVYNIPPTAGTFSKSNPILPIGAVVAKNSSDKNNYVPPCPPKGSAHRYSFSLNALDAVLILPAGADANTVISAIQGHVVGSADLTATYSH